MLKHIPNILTIVRFLLIPLIIVYIIQGNYVQVIIILTLSGITDILDGFIARRFNCITDFGKLMDPLADKATQIAILIALCIQGILPVWIPLIIIIKESIMVARCFLLIW